MPGGAMAFSVDDSSGIDGTNSRINLINGESNGQVEGWIGTWNGEGYPVEHSFTLAWGDSVSNDLAYAAAPVQLELEWSALDGLLVDWNIAALVQVDPGALKNVYLWNEGDCSYLSSTCTPMLLAQFPDGSTATVEGSFGWAG